MELESTSKSPVHRGASMRQVARNTAFMLAGEAGVKLLGFAFTVFVVRRLGAAEFGRYSAALAFVLLFAVLTDLGSSTLSIREIARDPARGAAAVADAIGLRLLLSLVAIVVIPTLAWLLGQSAEMVVGIFVASISLVMYAAAGPVHAFVVAHERLDLASVVSVLHQVLFITAGTIALLIGAGFMGLLVSLLMAQLFAAVAITVLARRRLGLRFERPVARRLRPFLRRALPFFFSQMGDMSMRRFDIVYLSFVVSAVHVGWYSVSLNLVLMLLPIGQSLSLSIFPPLLREHAAHEGQIQITVQRAVRYVLLLSLPMAVGGSLLSDRIVSVLYTPAFAPAGPPLAFLVWALPALFLSDILGYIALTLNRERGVARISMTAMVLTAGLVATGVAAFGLVGAAAAAVLARWCAALAILVLVDAPLVLAGNVGRLARIAAAAAVMGGGLIVLERLPGALPESPAGALVVLLVAGSACYGLAALALKAVDLTETAFLWNTASQFLRRVSPRA